LLFAGSSVEVNVLTTPTLSFKDVKFGYEAHRPLIHVGEFSLRERERVFLYGRSGSGKSTMLGLAAGILASQKGSISICGQVFDNSSSVQRDHLRADHIGYVFQQFNLVPYLSVEQNILLPLRFSQKKRAQEPNPSVRVRELCEALRLTDCLPKRVSELSVGQQQRAAVARALMGRPSLLIADEPTSSLDADTRDEFLRLLTQETSKQNMALLFVSHDQSLAKSFDRTIAIENWRAEVPS